MYTNNLPNRGCLHVGPTCIYMYVDIYLTIANAVPSTYNRDLMHDTSMVPVYLRMEMQVDMPQ